MEIILSIKPRYMEKILSGEKTVEIRSRKMNISPNTKIWLYSTTPDKSIVGYVSVIDYVYGNREEIWTNYRTATAINEDEYIHYTKNQEKVSAIIFGEVQELEEKISLTTLRSHFKGFQPPQFYKIINKTLGFNINGNEIIDDNTNTVIEKESVNQDLKVPLRVLDSLCFS